MLYLAARNQKNSFHLCLVEAEIGKKPLLNLLVI